MKFLITAGPTREAIDPVRFISNRSSGKMGYAIARAAREKKHEVTLISGPVCLPAPKGVEILHVVSSDEMFEAVKTRIAEVDCFVMCAAVADFKAAEVRAQKIKKRDGLARLALIPTRDILSSLQLSQKKIVVVGFAAETQMLAQNARRKLCEKKCDLIIANDVSRIDTGFESDDNAVTLFFSGGETRSLPRENKKLLAHKLLRIFTQLVKNR